MAEIALITLADIQGYEDVSDLFDLGRLNAYIQEAQRLKLRELLGAALYQEMFSNVSDIDTIIAPYDDLINGVEYEIIDGEPIQFYGIKPYLCYEVLCIMFARNNFRITDYGNMGFSNDPQSYMNKPSRTERRDAMNSLRQSAADYRNDIVLFLNEKYSTYPLWDGGRMTPKRAQVYIKSTLS